MKVLYLANNPNDEATLRLEREITQLQIRIANSSGLGVKFVFMPELPIERWPGEISRIKPDILHVSAHGTEEGLIIASGNGTDRLVTKEAFAAFLDIEIPPKLVLISACDSQEFAFHLTTVVPMAIGMTTEITNPAAIESACLLYERLIIGQPVSKAFTAFNALIETLDQQVVKANIFTNGVDIDREFFLVTPRIVARIDGEENLHGRDQYEIVLGMVGCPKSTHQIVFFTDDDDFIENEDEDLVLISRGNPDEGVLWADDSWFAFGDFRMFACGVTADGELFTATTKITDALQLFHRVKSRSFKSEEPAELRRIISELKSNNGTLLYDHKTSKAKPRKKSPEKLNEKTKAKGKTAKRISEVAKRNGSNRTSTTKRKETSK